MYKWQGMEWVNVYIGWLGGEKGAYTIPVWNSYVGCAGSGQYWSCSWRGIIHSCLGSLNWYNNLHM